MLAGPDPSAALHLPEELTQDDPLHDLSPYRGQADRPVVSGIIPPAFPWLPKSHMKHNRKGKEDMSPSACLAPFLRCGGLGILLHPSFGNPPEGKQDAELECVSGAENLRG